MKLRFKLRQTSPSPGRGNFPDCLPVIGILKVQGSPGLNQLKTWSVPFSPLTIKHSDFLISSWSDFINYGGHAVSTRFHKPKQQTDELVARQVRATDAEKECDARLGYWHPDQ